MYVRPEQDSKGLDRESSLRGECTEYSLPQVVWKPVQNKAPDLYNFIENFSFDWGEYITLLDMFNQADETEDQEDLLERVACAWLNHEVVSPSRDHLGLTETEHRM